MASLFLMLEEVAGSITNQQEIVENSNDRRKK
jgi:hypothetical protein